MLQLIQVGAHLFRIAIQVLFVVRRTVGFELQDGQHVHIVDPETGFRRQPIGARVLPLTVCPAFSDREIFRVFGLDGNLQRYRTKNGVVDMVPRGCALRRLRAARHERLEFVDQLGAQCVIVGECGKGERRHTRWPPQSSESLAHTGAG